ncbi:MAG: hypothetical protein ACTSQY_00060 [Candidatus Odinarchaeia archaeon]|nr:MAG: hypothetical protein [Lokiarchaeota virus Fenrir Meg22_1012]URC17191.1 MAG: hypothetical protein [Lokiarchaeota virus Fenrir Meg22_1214]
MIEEKILTNDYELESINEKEDKFYFTAISLNKDFECEDLLKALAKKSIGKPYIWRHQHPIQDGNEETHIFGEVINSKLSEDGKIISTYEVYGHTKEHKALRDLIRERHKIGEPLGISMRYRKYLYGDKTIHVDVFEHSGTPYPKCEKCSTIQFMGEKNMEDNKKEDKPKDELNSKNNDEALEESLKKIKEIEEQLNTKTRLLEEFKTKIETLEKEKQEAIDSLNETKKSEKTLEEKIKDLRNEVDYLRKKPLLDEIMETVELDDRELEFYKSQDVEYLKKKVDELKEKYGSYIAIKTQEESAEEARRKAEEELSKKEPTMEEFTKNIRYKFKNNK